MFSSMIIAMSAVLSAATGPAAKADISSIPWMTGAWVTEQDARWSDEWWTSARGGMMLGASRSGSGGTLNFFEHMRIVAEADGLAFYAMPGGKSAVRFPAISLSANQIVFENSKHDYPTRILYRREGAALIAEISGPNGSKTERWTYRKLGN